MSTDRITGVPLGSFPPAEHCMEVPLRACLPRGRQGSVCLCLVFRRSRRNVLRAAPGWPSAMPAETRPPADRSVTSALPPTSAALTSGAATFTPRQLANVPVATVSDEGLHPRRATTTERSRSGCGVKTLEPSDPSPELLHAMQHGFVYSVALRLVAALQSGSNVRGRLARSGEVWGRWSLIWSWLTGLLQ